MELDRISCPYCGGNYDDYDPQAKTQRCTRIGCGATFSIPQAKSFAKVQVDHDADIKSLRHLLDEAISQDDPQLMEQRAHDIRMLIPDDAFAAYCEAMGQKRRGLFKEYADHFKNIGDITQWEADRILAIALKEEIFTIHDEEPLKAFVQAKFLEEKWEEKNREIARAMARLIELANLTASVPRDVFICHSSKDTIAQEVSEILTNDGISCWISERNIPKGTVYYWKAIYEAIEMCKIFLVITSKNSMLSQDPQQELIYARSLNKGRMEFKIDDTEHTKLFKHFFDGIQWVKLGEDKEATFEELKERVYRLLHEDTAEEKTDEEPKSANNAPPSYLTVHYMDDETQVIFQDETRELQPGTHNIIPNPDYAPKDALFGGETVKSVEIPSGGGIQKEITFRYKLLIHAVHLNVRYIAQGSGVELAREQRRLSRGKSFVIANEGLIPKEYRLAGESRQAVSVDRFGAEPSEIIFECRLRVQPISIRVRYVLKAAGTELASEQREVKPGKQILTANESLIPPAYRLSGDRFQEVKVEKDSANPAPVTFECRLKVEPVTISIRYTDSKNKEIATPTAKTLPAGIHMISPEPKNLPIEYKLYSSENQKVTVTEYGAKPDTVVFCYKAPNKELQKWQNFGKNIFRLLCAAWLLLLVFSGLGILGSLPDEIFRELPFLLRLNRFLQDIYARYGDLIRPFGKSNSFTFLTLSGTLLILAASLPFGARIVQWNARHLSRWLYLLVPANVLLILAAKMPYSIASGILQDKLIFFLEYLFQPAAALVTAKLLERAASQLIRT